jgi:peptidoglycan/LPS O-acetylase OafA/YrhL
MPSLSYRRDIDGLRGLAIGLVVVFHVFIGRVSSGVDVFLFLGGMFFVGPRSATRSIRRAGRLSSRSSGCCAGSIRHCSPSYSSRSPPGW